MREDEVIEREAEEGNGPENEEEPEQINDSESDDIGRDVPDEGPVSF